MGLQGEDSSTCLLSLKATGPERRSHHRSSDLFYPVSLHLSWTLIMDIPIQYPWYRRVLSPRASDVALAELVSDWPPIWPFAWSLPWVRPSFLRWFNWADNGNTEMRVEKDRYVIYVDVKHFSPEELSVNVDEDCITVHGRHDDKQDDHGFVSREFVRKYKLPAGVTAAEVTSSLSFDGVLTITAPRASSGQERSIPITSDDGTAKQKK